MPPVSKRSARRAHDLAGLLVDRQRAPARVGIGTRRPPRRRRGQRLGQRRAGEPGARVAVAGALDLADQGRVDEAVAALGGRDAGGDGAAQQRRGGHPLAPVGVQRAELAVRLEARERRVELGDEAPGPLGRLGRRRQLGPAAAGSPISRRTWLPIASKVTSCSFIVLASGGAGGDGFGGGGGAAARLALVAGALTHGFAGAGDDGGDDLALDHLAQLDRAAAPRRWPARGPRRR